MKRTTSLARAWILACALIPLYSCSDDEPAVERTPCNYHSDCPNQGACYQGFCNPTASCFERTNCKTVPVCAGDICICNQESNRCYPVCESDNDCSSEALCLDGVCTKMPATFDGLLPESGARGNLKVGLGRVDLDFPMGVSMAGYASRQGPRTPYQDSLGGSNAWFERIDVRAIAFDDGKEMFVLLRIPLGWSTDELQAMTALKVKERIGLNLVDRIITTAPHSHALPARFWHLIVGFGFGFFGYDEFNHEIFDRLSTSFAEAVVLAVENMQPAKFGYTVLDNFDPEDRIHRDRRGENNRLPGDGKDARMVLMRIDDMNGDTLAVLTHFGIHGTVFDFDNPIVTGDAPGAVEAELSLRASEKYGHPVMSMFIQGNAGDVSPSGDDKGHRELEQMQLVGKRAWEVMGPALDSITTKADVEVGVITGRVLLTHEAIGYSPGEFFDSDVICGNSTYFRYGAFQCVEGGADDEDPATRFSDGDLNCVFAVECLTDGHPVPQFQKTHLAVVKLGDLTMATMPGEPLSTFGKNVSERVKEVVPGTATAITLGYSMDHHFYLLNEDDWLQGGYEPSRDIWGWRLGPYLTEKSVELAKELAKDPADRFFDSGNLKPMVWNDAEETKKPIAFTETEGEPNEVMIDVADTVERMAIVDFAWRGGHPGLDQPRIALERETNGSFVQVMRPGNLPYEDGAFDMIVHYDGSCGRANCDTHQWRVTWEESRSFPLGKYRFKAKGRALRNGNVVSYEALSNEFEVVPSASLELYGLTGRAGNVEARLVDPRAVKFVPDGERMKANERAGHRLRSEEVPQFLGAPLPEGTVLTVSGNVQKVGSATVPLNAVVATLEKIDEARTRIVAYDATGAPELQDSGIRPTTKVTFNAPAIDSAGQFVLTLRIEDQLGNFGTTTATITVN
jgi:neutral ceramidase